MSIISSFNLGSRRVPVFPRVGYGTTTVCSVPNGVRELSGNASPWSATTNRHHIRGFRMNGVAQRAAIEGPRPP